MFLMNLPIAGRPLEILDYFRGKARSHLFGLVGGMIWAGGFIAVYVASSAPDEARVTAGMSFALIQAAPLVAALWGLVAWKEFAGAGIKALSLQIVTLFLYAAALVMFALAPFSPIV
jgi:glucose uptake protein